MQIDFTASFDRVNHRGIIYWRFFFVYIDSFYHINYNKCWWTVIGVNLLMLCQECYRKQCFGPVIVPPYTSELFSFLENKLIGDADDSTLLSVVPPQRYSSRVP